MKIEKLSQVRTYFLDILPLDYIAPTKSVVLLLD